MSKVRFRDELGFRSAGVLNAPGATGRRILVFEGLELLERLSARVPGYRFRARTRKKLLGIARFPPIEVN